MLLKAMVARIKSAKNVKFSTTDFIKKKKLYQKRHYLPNCP